MFKERIKTHHSAMSEGNQYALGMRPLAAVLNMPDHSQKHNATIYIHVPFCNKICSFCNMRRSLQKPADDYAQTVVKEIEGYAKFPYIQAAFFDAVYFGGGTPTTLDTESLCSILRALKANFHFTENAEFTIETTVTELTEEKATALVQCGVNRFSVGVQTFDNAGRAKMGRIGSGEAAFERLKYLKGFEKVTVSMDLIYNYPEQTMESLYADLDKIIALDLDGFSMYSLINMKGRDFTAQDESTDEKMFFAIVDYMKQVGYHFLELTKMVRSDRYKYIMNRHDAADTLPLGAGAGGSIHHLAMMNPIDLDEYRNAVKNLGERVGMLFRPEYDNVTRFKGAVQTGRLPEDSLYRDMSAYHELLDQLINNELVVEHNGIYRLTEKGIFWGNSISRKLSDLI